MQWIPLAQAKWGLVTGALGRVRIWAHFMQLDGEVQEWL